MAASHCLRISTGFTATAYHRAERQARSGSLCAQAGQGLPPFPAPLCPLAAAFLRFATDRFPLTKANTFPHNRVASVATLDGVRDYPGTPFGFPSERAFGFAGIPTITARREILPLQR